MNSNHAEDWKELSKLIREWVHLSWQTILGEREIELRPPDEIAALLVESLSGHIAAVGGSWLALSDIERAEHHQQIVNEIKVSLGAAAYAALSEVEKFKINRFIWLGCCMHKELNSVKGGNAAMIAWWVQNGVPGPVLLLNKFNAANLPHILSPSSSLTPAEKLAFNSSTCGGVKITTLLGSEFKHKDDKKGQQATYSYWMEEQLGHPHSFPDTSNTRFQSHGGVATVLIIHQTLHIKFMEFVRDGKQDDSGFMNLEENIYRGLQDPPTLTELAILAIYG
ncbi:hypothetical protein OE88DRAFT_1734680 [Heliocybe sulcata]|uniref:Uncharacterized protein n=1 Tax=Heliocybe sulcata TaxID=5364 RepID=A0A5C3N2W8_9AGAM|nr:hypothetical protein OE88DRAFT_1734680 [Heliocybe sulcata]